MNSYPRRKRSCSECNSAVYFWPIGWAPHARTLTTPAVHT